MTKKEIREKLLEMRRSLTSNYIEDNSSNVFEKLIDLEVLKDAKEILIYSDFDGEVKTANLAGWLMYKGKNVYLPLIHEKTMYAASIKNAKLEISTHGYAQPQFEGAVILNPEDLDVIIVPGVAFDKSKNRIGYGYGYYDKYLIAANKAVKIALMYDFQLLDNIDTQEHDIKMDYLITPDEIV